MNDSTMKVSGIAGIEIELPIAGPGARAYAFTIDIHLRVLLSLAWWLGAFAILGVISFFIDGNFGTDFGAGLLWFATVPSILIYTLYHPVLEYTMRGMTPGKRFAGVRLVTEQGGVPGIGPILIRNVLRIIDSLPTAYAVGLIATMVTKNNVRIGDLAAGTVLVYFDKQKPQDLEVVDTLTKNSRLPPRQAAVVQELLDRWQQLDADSRRQLAKRTLVSVGEPVADVSSDDQLKSQLMVLLDGEKGS